jgi:rfaE bifunctional protein nucleotidyltransferase chain/domain
MSVDCGQILPCVELAEVIKARQAAGDKIVWTNGCFDILHAGHVLLLEQARALGDALVVGMNADASVRRLKGDGRPVNTAELRARVLVALRSVDYVVIFAEDSPASTIEALRPDIYAKGGDYTIETINQEERRLVEGYGGRIELMGEVEGLSTTNILARSGGKGNDADGS